MPYCCMSGYAICANVFGHHVQASRDTSCDAQLLGKATRLPARSLARSSTKLAPATGPHYAGDMPAGLGRAGPARV